MQPLRRVVPWFAVTLCASFVVPCASGVAHAEVAPEAREAARLDYERGLELAKHGDYTSALEAFHAAYAKSPHFLVLYNIGQAEVALGHPIAATEALERYLAEGGAQVPPARRTQVAEQLEWLRSRFAELSLSGAKPGARITVDGREVGVTPLAQPLRLAAGTHRISVIEEGAPAIDRSVVLRERERQTLQLDALPAEMGWLVVECAEGGVELLVDAQSVDWERAKSGVALAAGRHRVAFSAPGQRWLERTVDVRAGERAKLSCPTPASLTGTLAVKCVEPDVSVLIDGRPLAMARAEAGLQLGAGRHSISFRAPGRRFADHDFEMPGAAAMMLYCGVPERGNALAAPERKPNESPTGFTQTSAGWVTAGAGVLLGGATVGHYLWNRGRHQDWAAEDAALAGRGAVPNYRTRQLANNELADSIDRASRVSVGLAIGSGALLLAGSLLVLLDPQPARATSSTQKSAWQSLELRFESGLGRETGISYSGTIP